MTLSYPNLCYSEACYNQGGQHRMVLVLNFFKFFKLLFFALKLIYVT